MVWSTRSPKARLDQQLARTHRSHPQARSTTRRLWLGMTRVQARRSGSRSGPRPPSASTRPVLGMLGQVQARLGVGVSLGQDLALPPAPAWLDSRHPPAQGSSVGIAASTRRVRSTCCSSASTVWCRLVGWWGRAPRQHCSPAPVMAWAASCASMSRLVWSWLVWSTRCISGWCGSSWHVKARRHLRCRHRRSRSGSTLRLTGSMSSAPAWWMWARASFSIYSPTAWFVRSHPVRSTLLLGSHAPGPKARLVIAGLDHSVLVPLTHQARSTTRRHLRSGGAVGRGRPQCITSWLTQPGSRLGSACVVLLSVSVYSPG